MNPPRSADVPSRSNSRLARSAAVPIKEQPAGLEPLIDLAFARCLATVLPLSKGEGRGEGEQGARLATASETQSRSIWHLKFAWSLALGIWCLTPICFAQPKIERPLPLDPVLAEREARALVADLLAQKPQEDSTKSGLLKIRDSTGEERELPVRVRILSTPTNWLSVYEILAAAGGPGRTKLTVIHVDHQPNQYLLLDPGDSAANTEAKSVAAHETMIPFAGSDFWLADLGLEFLHWPKQRLLAKEMRHSKSCDVLESTNPNPAPGGYARVVCWITIDDPHGIVHADAYDASNKLLKQFDPKKLEKINGQYQLESMEMRTRKTGSRTILEFDEK